MIWEDQRISDLDVILRQERAYETLHKDHGLLKDKLYHSTEQVKALHKSSEKLRLNLRLACTAVAMLVILCAALIYSGGRY